MSGLRKAVLVATTSLVLISTGAGAASAADKPDPVTDLLDQVTSAVTEAVPSSSAPQQTQTQTQTSNQAAAPSGTASSTPSSGGVSEPASPDHASSHVLHGELLPGKLPTQATGDVGSSSSMINDDSSSSADATLLALGGTTLYGSQASSSGPNDAHGPAEPVCTNSNGAVCPLVADSHASQTSTSSDSSSKTSAASICLTPPSQLPITLPTGTTGSADCPAGLGLQALSSSSTMHRDTTTGQTSGSTQSSLAGACIPGAPNGGCVGLLTSSGSADSSGSTTRSSKIADFFGMSTPLDSPQAVPDQICNPTASSLPVLGTVLTSIPGVNQPTTGLCGYLNQGATYLGSGSAAVSQTALSGDLFGIATLDAGHSEVRAHQVAVPAVVSPPVTSVSPPATTTTTPAVHHTSLGQAVAGVLPHTGGIWSGWLAIGLLMLAAGSALAARDLRRGRVTG